MSAVEAGARPALATQAVAEGWRTHLVALGVVVALLLALFHRDAGDMAAIWWTSSTYEHCLVILPIIGWLVWMRLPVLLAVEPKAWALPLAWIALGGLSWLLGEAAGVAVARHLGLVLMVQGAIAAMLGRGVAAALLFPLFYAFFLVPAGDFLVPPLQTITAKMCMGLLHLIHVPATIDGVFLATPHGWFKVAEACSGAKFLIAMIALGALVAHLCFLDWRRRAAFLIVCLIAPVLANGIRAFGTIWVAQYRGAQAASGFDHVVYGWIFFAIVIAGVLAASWRFFDRPADGPGVDAVAVARQAAAQGRELPTIIAALAVFAVAGVAPLWSRVVTAGGVAPVAASARLPDIAGWSRIAATEGKPWRPRYDGADRLLTQRYRDGSGAEVDLAVALYASQGDGRTLVGFGHGAIDPDGDWSWASNLPAPPDALGERIVASGDVAREVVSFYRVGGLITGSPAKVKLATLRHHLLGGSQGAEALLVSAPAGEAGHAAIGRFLAALGPVGPALDRIAGGR